ncbi:MAG: pilus assembly protein PilN [Gammaproteobacteria bacterium]|nr:MAG: pilus assembly protein PilN [Gammaproteobacteria bacterium]
MAKINLLPWREELRRERRKQFATLAALVALLGIIVVGGVHWYFNQRIEIQNSRNTFIKEHIALLDKKIKEIKELERERERLLARMRAIEELRTIRPIEVHLMDEIVRVVPDGVYLTELVQKDNTITIKGVAESNARVSSLMRNVEQSEYLSNPQLKVIESGKSKKERANRFVLTMQLVTRKAQEGGDESEKAS